MISKQWMLLAAALACLQVLSSSFFVLATLFGDWIPVGTRGGFTVCTNASSCEDNILELAFLTIGEVSLDKSSILHSFSSLDDTQALTYSNESYVTDWGDGSSTTSAAKWFSAAIPNDNRDGMYALPAFNGDPVFTCKVTQRTSGELDHFGSDAQPIDSPWGRGALQVELKLDGWAFASSDNTLNLSMLVTLSENAQMTGRAVSSTLYSPTVMRFNLTKTVYLDLPLISVNANGALVTVRADVVGADGRYCLHVGLPASEAIAYTFLISDDGDIASFSTPHSTSNTPTRHLAAAWSRPDASSFLTALNTFPGGFEFCVAPNCNIFDGSFSVTLDRFGTDATVNSSTNELEFGFVTTSFSASDKQLVFETPALSFGKSVISSTSTSDFQTLYLSVPLSGGPVNQLTEVDFVTKNDTDTIFVVLSLEHLAVPNTLQNRLTMAKGALKMSLSVSLLGSTGSASSINNLTSPAISFFISAFQHGKMVTDVTVSRLMTTTQVIFGDDMYLEFPLSASINGSSYPLQVVAKLHMSGEFQGLIQLSLLVSHISNTFICEAAISSAAVDKGMSRTNEWTPALAPTKVQSYDIMTRILTLAKGEFGLCFRPTDCGSSSVKLMFSGIGTTSSSNNVTTQLGKFRNAAAFQFREPQLVTDANNVSKWNTGFHAFVPQSQTLPPIPYDASLVSTLSYPDISVDVDQFLAHGSAMNGDQEIYVSRGALKFAINITNWVFANTTDTLVLNVTFSDVTSGSRAHVPGALGFKMSVYKNKTSTKADVVTLPDDPVLTMATLVDFPLLAVVDSQMQAVGVALSFDATVGLTFTLTFPYFAHSLYYDPVLSSSALEIMDQFSDTYEDDASTYTSTNNRAIVIVLVVFLAFVVIVSVVGCRKRIKPQCCKRAT